MTVIASTTKVRIQTEKGSGKQQKVYYVDAGFKLVSNHATWPDGSNGVEAGLFEIRDLMIKGKFKVFAGLRARLAPPEAGRAAIAARAALARSGLPGLQQIADAIVAGATSREHGRLLRAMDKPICGKGRRKIGLVRRGSGKFGGRHEVMDQTRHWGHRAVSFSTSRCWASAPDRW